MIANNSIVLPIGHTDPRNTNVKINLHEEDFISLQLLHLKALHSHWDHGIR